MQISLRLDAQRQALSVSAKLLTVQFVAIKLAAAEAVAVGGRASFPQAIPGAQHG